MRLVLDTNVLIAALISKGACASLFEHCVANHTIVLSDFIVGEMEEHLGRKFNFRAEDVAEAVSLLKARAEFVSPAPLDVPVCRDPKDDLVLATAVAGNATCLVTGDKDLLVLQRYRTIEIFSPRDFTAFEISQH